MRKSGKERMKAHPLIFPEAPVEYGAEAVFLGSWVPREGPEAHNDLVVPRPNQVGLYSDKW